MPKQDYYEEVKDALGDDFLFGDVGNVMVEIADKLKDQRDYLLWAVKDIRDFLKRNGYETALVDAAIRKAEGK